MTDMNKMFNMDTVMEAQRRNLEAVRQASGVMAEGYSAMAARQMQMMQSAMEESVSAMRDVASAKGMEDMMARQATYARRSVEQLSENTREVADMARKAQTEATEILSKQASANLDSFTCAATACASKK